MVMHGGADGELSDYGRSNDYVYDWDSTQLQTKLDIGGGARMPTLEDVILDEKSARDASALERGADAAVGLSWLL